MKGGVYLSDREWTLLEPSDLLELLPPSGIIYGTLQ